MIQKFIVHACKLQLINNIYQKTLRLGCLQIHMGAVWATSGGFYPYASGELLNLTFWVGSCAEGGACDLFRRALCAAGQGGKRNLTFWGGHDLLSRDRKFRTVTSTGYKSKRWA